jgi:hypothetical protein
MAGYDDFNVNVWDTLRVERAGKFDKPKHKSVLILFSLLFLFGFFVFAFCSFFNLFIVFDLKQKCSLFILLNFCHVPTTCLEIEKKYSSGKDL